MPKRRRTDEGDISDPEAEEDGGTPVTRSTEVWMSDGSVILQAGGVQFKVHRSILSKHSPIFADLFEVPHPDSEPTIEGCPIVELHDSSEDVEHMLLALYGDPRYTNVRTPMGFPAIAAMVRLGRKYDIRHLRNEGLARLKLEFPTKLEDFEKLCPDEYTHIDYLSNEEDPAFSIIRLAHECKIRSILPPLYFLVARKMLETLPDSEEISIPYTALRSCIQGRLKFLQVHTQTVYRWTQLVGAIDTCYSKKTCQNVSRRTMRDLLRTIGEPQNVWDTWEDYAGSDAGKKLLRDICGSCRAMAQTVHDDGRRAAWDALPSYFKLPPWEELKDFED